MSTDNPTPAEVAADAVVPTESLGGIAPIEYKKPHEVEAAKQMYGASFDRLVEQGQIVVPDEAEEAPRRRKARKTAKKSTRKRSK